MNFEIKGKLHVKYDEVQITEKFKKREFVLFVEHETNIGWSDYIKFQLTQNKTNLIDSINAGDTISVNFNLRGREWIKDGKTNYFNTIEAWKIEALHTPHSTPEQTKPSDNETEDDLPF